MDNDNYIKHYEWMNCIKGGARRDVYATIYAFGGSNGGACLTIKYIAKKAGYNEVQTQRAIVELRSLGLLEVELVSGKNSIYHTIYPPQKCTPHKNDTPNKNDTPHKNVGSTPHKNVGGIINNEINIERDILTHAHEIEKNKIEQPRSAAKPKPKHFIKPTVQEVQAYCDERQNGINGEEFCDFYESKGWVIGKSPMKDWRAAVRTWEKKHKNERIKTNNYGTTTTNRASQRQADNARAVYAGLEAARRGTDLL